jgi:hypothetical protein
LPCRLLLKLPGESLSGLLAELLARLLCPLLCPLLHLLFCRLL